VVTLYLLLLCVGVVSFLMHFLAQFRLAALLRRRYPKQWEIIAGTGADKAGPLRIWMRLQQVLRSPALALFDDIAITRWQRIWRYGPRLAWLCWFAAIALQWHARRG
jgi:hypothetical protein